MRNSTSKIQIRVLVPVIDGNITNDINHATFQQWVCENFGGFSVIPGERINGMWRNPATGHVEHDVMVIYYIWLSVGSDNDIYIDCRQISDKVMAVFGEKAVSIIRDVTVTPMIFS